MKILVVTGRLAENAVRISVKDRADILVLGIEVAAFTTPALLRRSLPQKKYDLILVPGLASGDYSGLEKEINTPVKLGPKHAVDLGFVLSFAEYTVFSSKIPACELLMEKRKEFALEKAGELEKNSSASLSIREMLLGGNSRMKVMAEVVDAGHLSAKELTNKILYFIEQGADIIDLGLSLHTTEKEARTAVQTARSATSVPLSVDTLDPCLLNTALDSGIDMALSLNSRNMDEVGESIIKNSTTAVIIPDRSTDVDSIYHNIDHANKTGITNIIADPVLEPTGHGFLESLYRFREFRKRDRTTPLFFGVGNVTELMDADSQGVHAILSSIAMELDASVLFTPEYSFKARGSVSELRTASIMMMLAKDRGSAPKDLGIDLLVLKEKRGREFGKMPENAIDAQGSEKWHPDPAGCFRIEITNGKIQNGKFCPGKIIARNNDISIAGATAKEVLDTIIRLGLVSRHDHAAYLGRELMKAELALKFRRSYSQDDEF
ncbi:MAG: dihydropteroate synthase-like protein [Candidatus Methanoperedens sp.]|nr:dihydropteroate synthase-like protein [Candidatus Methanoperedens sp.]